MILLCPIPTEKALMISIIYIALNLLVVIIHGAIIQGDDKMINNYEANIGHAGHVQSQQKDFQRNYPLKGPDWALTSSA